MARGEGDPDVAWEKHEMNVSSIAAPGIFSIPRRAQIAAAGVGEQVGGSGRINPRGFRVAGFSMIKISSRGSREIRPDEHERSFSSEKLKSYLIKREREKESPRHFAPSV